MQHCEILAITGADLLWVIGNLDALLLIQGFTISGVLIVATASACVLCFALIQFLGLRKITRQTVGH